MSAPAPAATRRRLARSAPTAARGDAQHVDAVLLACEGSAWLPETLTALAAQTRRPDSVTTFDAASRDASADILADFAAETGAAAHAVGRATSLLDAALLLTSAADAAALTSGHARPDGWLWLLHDDSAPEPDALEQLLAAVEVAPSVGIAGAKLRDWYTPSLLREAGFTASALGRPLTGVESGESDQGQRDHAEDVLAVSTAGMLIHADLLTELGGDPALPVLGDALDLCRRARLAGARVIVVPGAVLRHADATREGLRDTPTSRAPRWATRRAAVHSRLVVARTPLLPLVIAAVLAGGAARALVRVAIKQPGAAAGELAVVLGALARPRRIARARRAAARTARRPPSALQPLLAPRRDVLRWHRDRWHGLNPPAGHEQPEPPAPGTDDHAGDHADDHARDTGAGASRGRRGTGLLLALLLALTGTSLAALARLVGGGDVVGGALLPAPSWGALEQAATSSWSSAGLGAAAPADPWLQLLTLLALPLGGDVGLTVRVLLLGAVPLAGLGGWLAAAAATPRRGARALAALVWAASPPLLQAVSTGRLGAVVAHLLLPVVALGLARTVRAGTRRQAVPAAAGTGLAAAVVVCGAPMLLAPLLVLLVVVAVTGRRWVTCLLWSALAPLAAMGPLLASAATSPRALLLSPGGQLAQPGAPAWQQALGIPAATAASTAALPAWLRTLAAPGSALVRAAGRAGLGGTGVLDLPALATGVALALTAAAALAVGLRPARRARSGRAARAGLWCAATGLTASVATTALGGGAAWTGPACSLVVLGLGAAALALTNAAVASPGPTRPGPTAPSVTDPSVTRRRPAVRAAAALALAAGVLPMAELAAWGSAQASGALGASAHGLVRRAPTVAAVARDGAASPDAVRTLTLDPRPDGSLEVSLARGEQSLADVSSVRLAAAATPPRAAGTSPDVAQRAVAAAAATLVAGGAGARRELTDLGVAFVLVPGSGERAAGALAGLDAAPGLARAGSTRAGTLYRVLPSSAATRPARARLLDASGATIAALPSRGVDVRGSIPAAPAGTLRTLVLAERSDPGWHASVGGRALQPTESGGWAAAFEVGAGGGHLRVTHTSATGAAWTTLQVTVLALTALLALPVPGRRRRQAR